MLALSDDELAEKLASRRAADHAKVLEKNARIEAEFNR
jgi:phosphoribosylcarboxyaminoimidazole (NCAIR) mutase